MTGTLVCAQITAARLRRKNRRLHIVNALLVAGFLGGMALAWLDAWHVPAGWLSLLP
jgi:hypothetical protein